MLWTEVFLWIIQTKHHMAKNYSLWLSQYFLQSYLSTVSTLYLVFWIAKMWKSGEYLALGLKDKFDTINATEV